MKKWLFILLVAVVAVGCSEAIDKSKLEVVIPEEMPKELDDLKNLLSETKQSQKKLDDLLVELEQKIGELDTSQVRKVSVTAVRSRKGDLQHFTEIQGSVKGEDPIMASAESGGRLTQMKWKEGDFIKKGDLVATLDMESVSKQIAELETRLDLAKTVYERQKRLWDQNIGSEMQYLQAENNMKSLQKSIETVRFQTTKANVYSPASGTVDRVMIQQGEMSGPGSPILMITNTSQVKVVAGVPEKYLKIIKKGQMVTVKFPSLDEERKARVSMIGRQVNAANRTFDVEVTLSNPGGILKPNLLSMMMLNDETIKGAVMIPEELIRQDVIGRAYVFVVENTGEGEMVKKALITTGSSSEGYVVVEEGLDGKELIIAKGGRGLSEGQRIEVQITSKEEENNG